MVRDSVAVVSSTPTCHHRDPGGVWHPCEETLDEAALEFAAHPPGAMESLLARPPSEVWLRRSLGYCDVCFIHSRSWSLRVQTVSIVSASKPYEVALTFRDDLPGQGPHHGVDDYAAYPGHGASTASAKRARRVRHRTRQPWSALSLLRATDRPWWSRRLPQSPRA
jgi:hypothetical protein